MLSAANNGDALWSRLSRLGSFMTWCDMDDCAVQTGGRTPLHHASQGGNAECVKLLLDKGVGVDVQDVSWLLVEVGLGQGAVRQHGWVTV